MRKPRITSRNYYCFSYLLSTCTMIAFPDLVLTILMLFDAMYRDSKYWMVALIDSHYAYV